MCVCVCVVCEYTCSAMHSWLSCIHTTIHSCPVVQPEIVIPLVTTTLPQGSSHMFVCAAVADPQPVFVFRFNGERITSSSSKHTLFTNSTHGTLTVLNIQGSDEGTYSCSASNRYGSVSTAAVLSVEGTSGLAWV